MCPVLNDPVKLISDILSIISYLLAIIAFCIYLYRARKIEVEKIRIQTLIQIHRKISKFLSHLEVWSSPVATASSEEAIVRELLAAYNESLDDFHSLLLIYPGEVTDKLQCIYVAFRELRRHYAHYEASAQEADFNRQNQPEAYKAAVDAMGKAWKISRENIPEQIHRIHSDFEANIRKYIGVS